MDRGIENNNKLQTDFLDALLEGNRTVCTNIVSTELRSGTPTIKIYEYILKPALYSIGELWEYNKISVATEHLASAIVEHILNILYPEMISNTVLNKKVIISCVENEPHQIGAKMVNDIFESNGWRTYFLGANTPKNDIVLLAKSIQPDYFAFSLSISFHFPTLHELIQKIRVEYPKTPIIIGGQAFTAGGQSSFSRYENILYLGNSFDIDDFIKNVE